MKIHRIIPMTRAEGPGVRMAVWTQGCSQHCKGCFAKDTWDSNGGTEVSLMELSQQVLNVCCKIEGLTILGGEPFEQSEEVAQLAKFAQEQGLGVITFTGFIYERLLIDNSPGVKMLLQHTDLLIDGEFQMDHSETQRPLVGSSNQRFHYLSERYSPEQLMRYNNRFEFRVLPDGNLSINGMGDLAALKNLLKELSL
ncbi:MAG: 4Fe-4S single cluster domain-containing protein [Ruminococcus sp.]